jgi:cation diffusion facilitator CzcD-associated flavoprotein CzcO
LEIAYYEVYNQKNVDLIDVRQTPILEATEKGLKTKDTEFEFDIIIFATGFDAQTGFIHDIDIRGKTGESLKQKWSTGCKTYLGMASSGFPNFFILHGPQAPSAFCNGPTCAEFQGVWMADLLDTMTKKNAKSVDPTAEAEADYRKHIDEIANATLFTQTGSWFVGANMSVSNLLGHVLENTC